MQGSKRESIQVNLYQSQGSCKRSSPVFVSLPQHNNAETGFWSTPGYVNIEVTVLTPFRFILKQKVPR